MMKPREELSDLEPEHHFGPGYSATALDQPKKPIPSAGSLLSAMERAVPEYRKKVSGGSGGAHRVDGFRDGWQACLHYLRSLPEGDR